MSGSAPLVRRSPCSELRGGVYTYVGNDPLDKTDPSGNCPECVGAIIGGGLEFAVEAIEISAGVRENYSAADIGISAVAGATGVGAARLVGRAAEIGKLGKFLVNRLVDGSVSAGSQEAKKGEVSGTAVAVDVLAGAVVGEAVAGRVASAAEKSSEARILARQADRARRVAEGSTRAARQQAAQAATAAQADHAASAAASAGVSAANAASSTVHAACVATSNGQKCD